MGDGEGSFAQDFCLSSLALPSSLALLGRPSVCCLGFSLSLGLYLPYSLSASRPLFLEVVARREGRQMLEPEVHTLRKAFSAFRAAQGAPSWQTSPSQEEACGALVPVWGFLRQTH